MKQKILTGLVTGLLVAGIVNAALATSFTDTVDFSGDRGRNYITIEDDYSYTHTLEGLTSPPYILDDATLSIRHNGNQDGKKEIWFSYAENGGNDILIGEFADSNDKDTWVIDTWTLSPAVLDLMDDGAPWALRINLLENTNKTDSLKIDDSILLVNYHEDAPPENPLLPSPEPATVLSFGIGLMGIAAALRRRKR